MVLAPAGRGTPTSERWGRAAAFTVGGVTGALLSALVVLVANGLLRAAPAGAVTAVVAGAALALLAIEVRYQVKRLPQNRHQVPQSDVGTRGWGGPFQFGFELGTGVRTYVSSVGSYALLIALVLPAAGVVAVVLAAVGFGLARGVHPVVFGLMRADAGAWRRSDHVGGLVAAALVVSVAVSKIPW